MCVPSTPQVLTQRIVEIAGRPADQKGEQCHPPAITVGTVTRMIPASILDSRDIA